MESLLDALRDGEFEARLLALGERLAPDYQSARPFPHAALDDFLPAEALRRAAQAFPSPADWPWERFEGKNEKKLGYYKAERMPPPLRDAFYLLNSAPVLRFLEKMTGIEGLIPDPYFFGGGLHQTEPGGRLEIHVDFNRIPQMNLNRRLNLLVYLNEDWPEEYGGWLELWNADMTRCERKILPIFNRCVVFSTIPKSFHGQPIPLACPPGRARRSLATYYYTAGAESPAGNPEWKSTQFQERPGERGGGAGLRRAIKRLVPPILADAIRGWSKKA